MLGLSRAAEFTDCTAVPVLWGLLLHKEGPQDGDWTPEVMVGHPTLVGHWHRGAAVVQHISEKYLGLEGPKASVDTPRTDVAPEGRKPRRDVSFCAVLTHLPGLKQGSFLAVLSCTDPRTQTSKIN